MRETPNDDPATGAVAAGGPPLSNQDTFTVVKGTWACNEAASEAGSLPPLLCRRLLLRASTKTDLGEAGRPKGYTEGPRGNAVVLIETDGPYMRPEPCRGQTAHPGHVRRVAERVAEWQCVDLGRPKGANRESNILAELQLAPSLRNYPCSRASAKIGQLHEGMARAHGRVRVGL